MAEPFLGEIRIVSFNFAPLGWQFCNGQLLPINENQALFSLLGTTFGGNGTTNFALPNLQGRTPIHVGTGFNLGQVGGQLNHTLTQAEMPSHTHVPLGNSGAGNATTPVGNAWAAVSASASINAYDTTPNGTMLPAAVGQAGSGQPHNNLQPYLVLNIIIALQGIFPSRN